MARVSWCLRGKAGSVADSATSSAGPETADTAEVGNTEPEGAPHDWRSLVLETFVPLTSRGLAVDAPLDRPSPMDVVYFRAGARRLRVGLDGIEGELLVQLSMEGDPWRDLSEFLAPEVSRRLHLHRMSRRATRGMLAARLHAIVGALAEAELLPGLEPGQSFARGSWEKA